MQEMAQFVHEIEDIFRAIHVGVSDKAQRKAPETKVKTFNVMPSDLWEMFPMSTSTEQFPNVQHWLANGPRPWSDVLFGGTGISNAPPFALP